MGDLILILSLLWWFMCPCLSVEEVVPLIPSDSLDHLNATYLNPSNLSHILRSNVSRYIGVKQGDLPKKDSGNLLAFISITSGAHHYHLRRSIRDTWLLPCMTSKQCAYRFFVDTPSSNITKPLRLEQEKYSDMVFRDSCGYMHDRHPDYVHYGNAHVYDGTVSVPIAHENSTATGYVRKSTKDMEGDFTKVDYRLRKMYKIDWKMCFLKYIASQQYKTDYHVFVEDDSFICTENLLFQFQKLREVKSRDKDKEDKLKTVLRTGQPLYDGFDDSSTIMSSLIGDFFVEHYLVDLPLLNCTKVVDAIDNVTLNKAQWLSWGNSWISHNCDWRQLFRNALSSSDAVRLPNGQRVSLSQTQRDKYAPLQKIDEPYMDCNFGLSVSVNEQGRLDILDARDGAMILPHIGKLHFSVNQSSINEMNDTSTDTSQQPLPPFNLQKMKDFPEFVHFPCHGSRGMIYHSNRAGYRLLDNEQKYHLQHMCEYMLLIDKIKTPSDMFELWNGAIFNQYHDMSDVFLYSESTGWLKLIKKFEKKEAEECVEHHNEMVFNHREINRKENRSTTWAIDYCREQMRRKRRLLHANIRDDPSLYRYFFNSYARR